MCCVIPPDGLRTLKCSQTSHGAWWLICCHLLSLRCQISVVLLVTFREFPFYTRPGWSGGKRGRIGCMSWWRQSVVRAIVCQSQRLSPKAVILCIWSRPSRWSMCRGFDIVALRSSRLFTSCGNTSDMTSNWWCWSTDALSGTKNCGASATLSELPSSSGSTCIPRVMMWHYGVSRCTLVPWWW